MDWPTAPNVGASASPGGSLLWMRPSQAEAYEVFLAKELG